MITKFDNFLFEYADTDILKKFIGNDNVDTYFHTTNSEQICKDIMNGGFQFVDFEKTTDRVDNDESTINYKLMIRKPYGNFTLVIQIKPGNFNYFEDLCQKEPFENEYGDLVYTLPREYVKGYFDRKTLEIVENPYFKL